jgi:hypothetical protein
MKPTLRIITEHRPRRSRRARHLAPSRPRAGGKASITPTCEGQDQREAANPAGLTIPDFALLRVQSAGGPVDCASYSCECGFVFAASVSTTVSCPHCGIPQAW